MKKTIWVVCIFLIFCSCREQKELNPLNSDFILNNFEVSKDIALSISNNFYSSDFTKNARIKGDSSSRDILELKEYQGSGKKTIFFITNFKNNKGFTIISADKRLTPILAWSEEGNFKVDEENNGIKLWIELVAQAYDSVQLQKSANLNIEKQWSKFEKNRKGLKVATTCQAPPSNVFVQHLTDAFSQWRQGTGYNFYSPNRQNSNCYCTKASAGCGPVAMAQVLRFHKKQINLNNTVFTTSDFNSMPRNITSICNLTNTNDLKIAWLIRSCGAALNETYQIATNCQSATIYPPNLVSLGNSLGYQVQDLKFYNNVSTVENEIISNRPVILYGSNCDICFANAHIWVLDGLQKVYWYDTVTMSDPQIGTWEECILNSYTTYQMNWGWDSSYNSGWYTLYNFNGGGTMYNNANMRAYTIKPL